MPDERASKESKTWNRRSGSGSVEELCSEDKSCRVTCLLVGKKVDKFVSRESFWQMKELIRAVNIGGQLLMLRLPPLLLLLPSDTIGVQSGKIYFTALHFTSLYSREI